MHVTPGEVAAELARNAEAVCRHYLSNGHRHGRYWIVGDARNARGQSMFVRLVGPATGKGAAGKWTDAGTGEHGDLLDILRESLGLCSFRDVMAEALRFLALPSNAGTRAAANAGSPVAATGSPDSARRLLAISSPIGGTLAETYLRARGIANLSGTSALRFHPRCYHRPQGEGPYETWPALLATVTDLDGNITGALRTWLARDGRGKAPLATPRRAMGNLQGKAVRFGVVRDVMIAGEGVETVLSLKQLMPDMPMAAALSAAHLAALDLPYALRRIYIARDDDRAGDRACAKLVERARDHDVEAIVLSPTLDDFNDDLVLLGINTLRSSIRTQFVPEDVDRFLR
jgi:hypothetical protein